MTSQSKFEFRINRVALNLFLPLMPAMLIGLCLSELDSELVQVCLIIQVVVNIYAYVRGLRKESSLLAAVSLSSIPLLINAEENYIRSDEELVVAVAIASFFLSFITLWIKYLIGNLRKKELCSSDEIQEKTSNTDFKSKSQQPTHSIAESSVLDKSPEKFLIARQKDGGLPSDYHMVVGGIEMSSKMRTRLCEQLKKIVDHASILAYTNTKISVEKANNAKVRETIISEVAGLEIPMLLRSNYLKFKWPVSHISRTICEVMNQMQDEVLRCEIDLGDEIVFRKLRPSEVEKVMDAVWVTARDVIDASNSREENTLSLPNESYYR